MFGRFFSGWSTSSTTDEDSQGEEGDGGGFADWRDGDELVEDQAAHDGLHSSLLRRSLLRGAGSDGLGGALQAGGGAATSGSESEIDEEFELLVQAYMHDVHYTSRPQAVYHLCYALSLIHI